MRAHFAQAKQEGAELRIDGKAASMVTIVGVLRSVSGEGSEI
jgi:hypothetical protein